MVRELKVCQLFEPDTVLEDFFIWRRFMNDKSKVLVKRVLLPGAYWSVNKTIAKEIGLNAAVILSDLIGKEDYFECRGELTSDGYFFNTTDNIENDTGLSRHQRLDAVKQLINKNWLSVVKRDIPSKNYFKINYVKIMEFLSSSENERQVVQKVNGNNNKRNNNKDIVLINTSDEVDDEKTPSSALNDNPTERIIDTDSVNITDTDMEWGSENITHAKVSESDKEYMNSLFNSDGLDVSNLKRPKKMNLVNVLVQEWSLCYYHYLKTEYVAADVDYSIMKSIIQTTKNYLEYYENKTTPTNSEIIKIVKDSMNYAFRKNEYFRKNVVLKVFRTVYQQALQFRMDEINKNRRNSNKKEIEEKI